MCKLYRDSGCKQIKEKTMNLFRKGGFSSNLELEVSHFCTLKNRLLLFAKYQMHINDI